MIPGLSDTFGATRGSPAACRGPFLYVLTCGTRHASVIRNYLAVLGLQVQSTRFAPVFLRDLHKFAPLQDREVTSFVPKENPPLDAYPVQRSLDVPQDRPC